MEKVIRVSASSDLEKLNSFLEEGWEIIDREQFISSGYTEYIIELKDSRDGDIEFADDYIDDDIYIFDYDGDEYVVELVSVAYNSDDGTHTFMFEEI